LILHRAAPSPILPRSIAAVAAATILPRTITAVAAATPALDAAPLSIGFLPSPFLPIQTRCRDCEGACRVRVPFIDETVMGAGLKHSSLPDDEDSQCSGGRLHDAALDEVRRTIAD